VLVKNCDEVVTGRTMDYDIEQNTLINTVSKGTTYGFGKSVYNFISFNGFGQPAWPTGLPAHGINEKGLSIAYLWLNPTQYPDRIDPKKQNVNVMEFASFVLGTMSSVDELVGFFEKGGEIDFVNMPEKIKKLDLMHQHFYCVDASGNTLIIEYIKGKRHMYRNQSPVLVNDPPFPQQKKIWRRQLATKKDIVNWEYNLISSKKMHEPDTRYEILRRLTEQSLPTKGIDNVMKAFQIMKRVSYMPITPYRSDEVTWTLYTAVFVHKPDAVKVYYNDANNVVVRMIDLATIDWSTPRVFPVATGPKFIEMNGMINAMKKEG